MRLYFEGAAYVAVIGDIVASKAIGERAEVQHRLERALHDINEACAADIASRFMITLGDEFQGLLRTGAQAAELIERIERAMYPVRVRFGLGVGAITTEIDAERPLGADGPAYHGARRAVEALKASERKRMESRTGARIEIAGYPDVAEVVNTIFALNTALKSRWAQRQREVVSAYLECGGTQSEVAQRLGIHQSNVQKALAHASFYTYQRALRAISQMLSGIGGPGDV